MDPFQSYYKIKFKADSIDMGLGNISPLRQLNSWAMSMDTYTLKAFIMAFGWRPFVFSTLRPEIFRTLELASASFDRLIHEASLLSIFSVTPRMSIPDLFTMDLRSPQEASESLREEVYSLLEIAPSQAPEGTLIMSSHEGVDKGWYVVHHNPDEGHLFLKDEDDRFTWVEESQRDHAWFSLNELEALSKAKTVTRREGYYVYPFHYSVKDSGSKFNSMY
ncbi:hypothetical protein ACI2KR_07560 [Pseudomonas luteola]